MQTSAILLEKKTIGTRGLRQKRSGLPARMDLRNSASGGLRQGLTQGQLAAGRRLKGMVLSVKVYFEIKRICVAHIWIYIDMGF